MIGTLAYRGVIAGSVLLAAACGSTTVATEPATQLISVSPRGGSASVALSPDIVFTFNHPMRAGMEQFMAMHQGDLTGPITPMSCSWSDGQRTLSCRPDQPLAAGTHYTLQVGGGMMDSNGQVVGMDRFGMGMGGQSISGGMMGGQTGMMGSGWMSAAGGYGMMFGFTTQ